MPPDIAKCHGGCCSLFRNIVLEAVYCPQLVDEKQTEYKGGTHSQLICRRRAGFKSKSVICHLLDPSFAGSSLGHNESGSSCDQRRVSCLNPGLTTTQLIEVRCFAKGFIHYLLKSSPYPFDISTLILLFEKMRKLRLRIIKVKCPRPMSCRQ